MVKVIRTTKSTPAVSTVISTPQEADTKLLIDFISASLTSTGQEEYYNTKEEQKKALMQIHKQIFDKYREFYALLLVSSINDLNKQIIILNLLKHGQNISLDVKDYENNLVLQALINMQTNRAYATLELLADNKVNNKRTRDLSKKFLENRKNYKFEFVKYKGKVKKIVTHNHLYKKNEIWDFLFDRGREFQDKMLSDYVKAKTDKEALYRLPYSIAEGFAAYHKIPREEFLEKIKDKMTEGEKMRITTSAKEHGVDVEADWTKGDLRKLLIYLYSTERLPQGFMDIIREKAKKEAEAIPYKYEKVAVIVDNSASAYGSEEKKYHPIASELALAYTIEALSKETNWYFTNEVGNRLIPQVGGDTNLVLPLVKALNAKVNFIFVLSDSYENVVSGAFAQAVNAFKRQIDKENKTLIVQFSSVFAAESHTIRQLSELVPSIGIADTKQLAGSLLLSSMQINKDTTLAQYVAYLKSKVRNLEYKNYLIEA